MKTHYQYSLERKGKILKLEIYPSKNFNILYLSGLILFCGILMFQIGFIILVFSIIEITLGFIIANSIVFLLECFIILFLFSNYWWRKKGVEIFTLYHNRLDYEKINKPFETEKISCTFELIEFGYQSGEDFFSETEAVELGVELDLDKAVGDYPIQFYMDNRKNVVESESDVPIEVIRKMRDEYLLINT